MRYKKKPVIIEAFQIGHDEHWPDWFVFAVNSGKIELEFEESSEDYVYAQSELIGCRIHTLEGLVRGERGDYIIQGVQGELYPCKPDIFAMTYELEE